MKPLPTRQPKPPSRPPLRPPVRLATRSALAAGLVAIVAVAGALSAVAATRTVETSTTLELQFWVAPDLPAAYVSTRQPGQQWTTHDFLVLLRESSEDGGLLASDPVSLTVPVSFEVDAQPPASAALSAPTPPVPLGEAPSGPATCCTVRGMSDASSAQRAVVAVMRRAISYGRTNFDLAHEGPITINIAHNLSGLRLRYREVFGEALDELPSECTFQRDEHIFIGPDCRTDQAAIAREWLIRAVQVPYLSARWVGVATFEYYWTLYQRRTPPTLRDDRYRSAIFHQSPEDFRLGRPHDDLMAAAMMFAIDTYGTFEDWRAFYDDVRGGAELHAAFEAAFGVPLVQLYADFEAWAERERANMLALAYRSCGEAAQYIVPRPLVEGGGFPDFRVPLEFDHDADGFVCEQYVAVDRPDELVCLIRGDD